MNITNAYDPIDFFFQFFSYFLLAMAAVCYWKLIFNYDVV